MKRLVIVAVIKIFGKVILLAGIAGIVVAVIGNLNKWHTSLEYGNAFFIAGSLLIIAGVSSRMAAGEDWDFFQRVYAESFRDMSVSERANFIVNASNSVGLLILGLLSGGLLILISVLVTKMF
ncbi:MAG: hypothetical protein JNK32_04785 [Anaerolineales bacterium]|nr:hypothetical protein [Anaerolineales bacterium]